LTSGGGAHTSGDVIAGLKLPKTTGQVASVSHTLVRLVQKGHLKKDRERGYRAA
jgi:hypothetical protein